MRDLFLCHTGDDKEWVEQLARRLESETINGRALSVWFDKWDIDYGENLLDRIEGGLRDSRYLAVVLSPALNHAEWPRLEWQTRVYEDPTGKAGRILPIVRHWYDPDSGQPVDIPLPLRLLKRFDFSDERQFERQLQELMRVLKGERPSRGEGALRMGQPQRSYRGQELPDDVNESIVSNLLPVVNYPQSIWSDLTAVSRPKEVWNTLSGPFVPPFLLREGRLYCFYPPGTASNPFNTLLTHTDPRVDNPTEWIDDPKKGRWLIQVLNQALTEHCYHLGIRKARLERTQYYPPVFDRGQRMFRWRRGGRQRTLAKMTTKSNGEPLGVHQSARMRFVQLGGDLYLLIEPGWLFTSDGATPVGEREQNRLTTKWGGRERNAAVLRNVLMWGLLLSEGERHVRIKLGDEKLLLAAVAAHSSVHVGIDGDLVPLYRILEGEGAGEISPIDAVGDADDDEIERMAADVVDEEAVVEDDQRDFLDTGSESEPSS